MRLAAFPPVLSVAFVAMVAACTGDDPTLVDPGGTSVGTDGGRTPGVTCSGTAACANGSPCVDGFCCDGACTGTCEACNVAGSEGKCSAKKGAPRTKCDGEQTGACAGSCDGTNRASCTFPEVTCGAGSCAGGQATLPGLCKAGACQKGEQQACTLGCNADTCLGVKQLAAGYYHACAALTDGKLRCWGSNDSGQTGVDVGTAVVPTPTEVSGISTAVQVAATFGSTCILLADKTVRCMGSNGSGQLGLGAADNIKHATPTTVPGLTDVTFIGGSSGGHYFTTTGTIKCWGSNGTGQLGDGTSGGVKAAPVTVCQPGVSPCTPSTGATFVAGGDSHTCAAFAGGKVACWGSNASGELGQPVAAMNPIPTFVTPATTATFLTAGNRATCAASAGGAKCWGSNGLGILGNGTTGASSAVPVSVCTKADCSTLLSSVSGVATYDESACGVAAGAVKCWGTNSGGQLGDGNTTASQAFAATSAIASGAVYVTSGGGANYAIVVDRANRDVRCWGSEGSNQCGTGGTSTARPTPVSPKW